MNFLIMGDLHVRSTTPQNRKDDFPRALMNKFDWIMELAKEHHATILQPGDWFDTPRTSYYLWQTYAKKLKEEGPDFLTIFGQHDMPNHTNPKNSPLSALHTMGLVHILDEVPTLAGNTSIYGASWNQDIPIRVNTMPSILVIHRLIAPDLMWPGQRPEEITIAKDLLEETDFKVIVSGDNHTPFQEEVNGRILFNCGSLMRSTIDQYDHQPCVVILDSDTWDYDIFEVPIEDPAKVFVDVAPAKQHNEKIQAFAKSLKDIEKIEMDYERNLRTYTEFNHIDKDVVDILNEALNASAV